MTDDEIKQAMQWASINTLRFPIHAMLSEFLELRQKRQWPSEAEFQDWVYANERLNDNAIDNAESGAFSAYDYLSQYIKETQE